MSDDVPGSRPGDRHRAAILEAAVELFHEVPLREVTVRRIAARAQVNPSLIYRYYGRLDDLFRAVSDVTALRIRESVAEAESPVDLVMAAGEFYRSNPAVWLRLVRGVAEREDLASTLGPESGFALALAQQVAEVRGVPADDLGVRLDVLMALYLVGGELATGPYAAGRLGLGATERPAVDRRLRDELERLLGPGDSAR